MTPSYDILVIGGGVNGCGIARDAAGRGWSVLLCEMNDLASGTSSWSTKLIHGGLRYLEYYEFRLVREALMERERLWAIAPHIIHPLRFVLPHHRGLRPAWFLRLGLFLYDHLGGRKRLPPTKTLDLRHDPAGKPLAGDYRRGFEYSDCAVDDARLVTLNACDARNRGARIETRTKVVKLERVQEGWKATLRTADGEESEVSARLVVNAAGPWVDDVLETAADAKQQPMRLVQGSHIVVPKLYEHDRAYIFQNADGRIVFAIPYEGEFTLIGTTDRDYDGDPAKVRITPEETSYLCEAISAYFRRTVRPDEVVWSFSGVRPLVDEGSESAQAATRDYVIKVDDGDGRAALVNVLGGKLTTYRRLAETVLLRIEAELNEKRGKPWTADAPLPGGDFPVDGLVALEEKVAGQHPGLPRPLIARLVRAYGTKTFELLEGVASPADLGQHFGADLYQKEVEYLRRAEFAVSAEDILNRRSKLCLHVSEEEREALDRYLGEGLASAVTAPAS
ncbi:glycerol-3-phosphate dehydrogenase [Afifella marina]|uniref:Glycerol-3-phosphate dehydrogenase n=1 Tax=Afifella marina DSM 2698 TaxID=1120955 RepID=A0A1G5P4M9_AFIMA|nr:glycerol-3-phosphate dehydrogenase [Afifella marina]MBK1625024.1 glycerol-3-phosphate dehydrogenase [Afifella marina DSM 2698]MBK1628728.1 glycerol-3-phosphate dehydrogenase [Afifella marina]MBK5918386.1 glycerol-3-phosphate dehydrogenase [Afifella marina]RAI19551.1 glycerol-3-phosphate dehydrogenase [Afifella marina DSM 2698]SCZ44495.1 glycerol-3-phosphate dehydrogenase [Afifella marina DSM 2698]